MKWNPPANHLKLSSQAEWQLQPEFNVTNATWNQLWKPGFKDITVRGQCSWKLGLWAGANPVFAFLLISARQGLGIWHWMGVRVHYTITTQELLTFVNPSCNINAAVRIYVTRWPRGAARRHLGAGDRSLGGGRVTWPEGLTDKCRRHPEWPGTEPVNPGVAQLSSTRQPKHNTHLLPFNQNTTLTKKQKQLNQEKPETTAAITIAQTAHKNKTNEQAQKGKQPACFGNSLRQIRLATCRKDPLKGSSMGFMSQREVERMFPILSERFCLQLIFRVCTLFIKEESVPFISRKLRNIQKTFLSTRSITTCEEALSAVRCAQRLWINCWTIALFRHHIMSGFNGETVQKRQLNYGSITHRSAPQLFAVFTSAYSPSN